MQPEEAYAILEAMAEIHNTYDAILTRVAGIHEIRNFLSLVNCSTVFPDIYMPNAAQRLHKYKYASAAVSDLFRIDLLCVTWAHGQGYKITVKCRQGQLAIIKDETWNGSGKQCLLY